MPDDYEFDSEVNTFCHENYVELVKFVKRKLPRRCRDAEDVNHDIWFAFIKTPCRFDTNEERRKFLYGVASNVIAEWYRRQSRRDGRERLESDVDGSVVFETNSCHTQKTDSIDLERALDGLPKRQAEAVRRQQLYGQSIKEIANNMNITENGAKKNLTNGKKSLRASPNLRGYEKVNSDLRRESAE